MCYRNAQRETGDIAVAFPSVPENARNATDRLRGSRWPGACAYPHAGPTATSISMGSMLNHAKSSTTIETRTIYRSGSLGARSLPADAYPRSGGMSERGFGPMAAGALRTSAVQSRRHPLPKGYGRRSYRVVASRNRPAEVVRPLADTAVVVVSRLGGRRHVSSVVRLKQSGV